MKSLMHPICLLTLLLVLPGYTGAAEVAENDVIYPIGDVRLSATVVAPEVPGHRPAMILMPGSGNQSRTALLGNARNYAAQGIVTLVYDKRGVGKSTGNWTAESLEDLADDALEGLRFLRTLDGVDAHRVGAWGISQSGWVLPRLALRDPDIAFVICVTGGGATPREVEDFGYRNQLLHAGFTETDWDAARPLVQRYMQYLATGEDRDALLGAIDAARQKKWSSVVDLARVLPTDAERAKWTWVATYDPANDIRAMSMPVLVQLGGRDPFSPSSIAVQRWQEGLAVAGNAHDRVISYPGAGHGIRTNGHEMRSAPEYAPGYMAEQLAWLREIGVLR